MDTIKENYQQALDFIDKKDYLRAKKVLEDIMIHYPDHSQLLWALALVEARMGNPYHAKAMLRSVSPGVIPQVRELQKQIDLQFPKYKVIFSRYNEGIKKVKKGQFQKALQDFSVVFHEDHDLPLPVSVYKAYLISLIHSGDRKKAFSLYNEAPLYIQQSIDLNRYRIKEEPKSSNRRWLSMVAFATVLVIGLFVGSKVFPDTKEIPIVAEDTDAVQVDEDLLSDQRNKIDTLESKLEEQMITYEALEDEYSQMEERIGFVTNLENLNTLASKEAYQQGLKAFHQEDYERAATLLEKSYNYDHEQYFSDDARYLQIQSSLMVGQPVEEAMVSFIESKSSHFQKSPYLDDLMLQLAELAIDKGQIEQATELLREIVDRFPQQWTANKAQTHLNRLLEEE
ncbi:tetratricopeptide repeat protein [Gracilibacillus kekensis]|uniref:TolA-binding protein n=1 Tax=Gracilibacillus kekensis TaxID=1027249 RepID=A0A1M7JML2_9BACI|nr:tetratricopeptide repeat protein [Gracilibacillus kekensis]SHM54216.1 TolA-binding protein [Gracilibacillus kekensis]